MMYFLRFRVDVPCDSKEEDGLAHHEHPIKELSPCSVITSYSFVTDSHRPHKLYIRVNETAPLEEYVGDVNMKVLVLS